MKSYKCCNCGHSESLFDDNNEIKNMCETYNCKAIGSLPFNKKLNHLGELGVGIWESLEEKDSKIIIDNDIKSEFEKIGDNIIKHFSN